MKKITGKLVLLVTMLGAATHALAQDDDATGKWHGDRGRGMHHDGMGDPTRMFERMSRHLDLDATQSQQLDNILSAAKPEIESLRDALHENRRAMHELDAGDPDYNVKLQNLSTSNAELAAKMTLLIGEIRADVHAMLTPEQLQQIDENRGRDRRHRRRHDSPDETQ